MPGDVKIGGGGSSYVYACVGGSTTPSNPVHTTSVIDDSPNTTVEVFRCQRGQTWREGKSLGRLTPQQLQQGEFLAIHW